VKVRPIRSVRFVCHYSADFTETWCFDFTPGPGYLFQITFQLPSPLQNSCRIGYLSRLSHFSHRAIFTTLGKMTDTDKAMNAQHLLVIRQYLDPSLDSGLIWIRIPDTFG